MAWEGAIGVSTSDDAGCIASNRFLSYMRCGALDIRYLIYYFQSKQGHAVIRGTSTGTVVRNRTLSIKDFEDLIEGYLKLNSKKYRLITALNESEKV